MVIPTNKPAHSRHDRRRRRSTRPSARSSVRSARRSSSATNRPARCSSAPPRSRSQHGRSAGKDPRETRHQARRAQRQAARARSRRRRSGGPQGGCHRLDQHGRSRHRHRARRQPRNEIKRLENEQRAPEEPSPKSTPKLLKKFEQASAPTEQRRCSRFVKEAGGLHILGTERHESRRIDNQLRGRSGRQGDPARPRFYPLARGRPDAHLRGRSRPRSP